MDDTLRSPVTVSALAAAYARDGCYFPYDVIGEDDAAALIADLEAAETELKGDRAKLSTLRSYPSQLLPSCAALIRHPRLLVSHVSGKDEYGHFEIMPPPAGRMLKEDFERARRNTAMKQAIFYEGVSPELLEQTRRA